MIAYNYHVDKLTEASTLINSLTQRLAQPKKPLAVLVWSLQRVLIDT